MTQTGFNTLHVKADSKHFPKSSLNISWRSKHFCNTGVSVERRTHYLRGHTAIVHGAAVGAR